MGVHNMNIYDFKANDKFGEEVSLEKYKGDVILVINSATKCGFTPQYDKLQDLYEKYQGDGFMILDFPCNQFANQAPDSNEAIASFCESNYGVTFPIFSKIEVNGENAHPLFKYLVGEKGFSGFDKEHQLTPVLEKILSAADPEYKNNPSIKWNFTKFLIDREGNVVERYEPTEEIYVIEDRVKEIL